VFDFKNYIIKIMSKYPSSHLVTLHYVTLRYGKIKTDKEKISTYKYT